MLGVGLSVIEASVAKLPIPMLRYQCIGTRRPPVHFSRPSDRNATEGLDCLDHRPPHHRPHLLCRDIRLQIKQPVLAPTAFGEGVGFSR